MCICPWTTRWRPCGPGIACGNHPDVGSPCGVLKLVYLEAGATTCLAAVMSSPRPSPYAPRSQALWPSRGSDPIVAIGGLVPMGTGQQRVQPQQPDLADNQSVIGGRGGQPLDRGLGFGFGHVILGDSRRRDRAVSPPKHPSQERSTSS